MLHDFELGGATRIKLWQRTGESYEHVLMKALGFSLFVGGYPNLQIEKTVGLRYKPDLVAINAVGEFIFWGECGANAIRKTNWLLKHAGVKKLVLFKIGHNIEQLALQLRTEISDRYRRDERLILINFVAQIVSLTADKKIDLISPDWYTKTIIGD